MNHLWRYIGRYRALAFGSVIASIIEKIFDLMPPLLTGWVIAVVTQQPPQWMTSLVGTNEPWPLAVLLASMAVFIFGVESLSQWLTGLGFMTLAQKVQHDVRMDAYEQLQRREIQFFEQHRLGETMAIVNDDVNQLERFLNTGVNEILQLVVLIIFASSVLFSHSWQLALVAMSPVPIIILGSLLFQSRIGPRYTKMREKVGALTARLENNLSGITVIKSFTAEQFESNRVREASKAYCDANYHAIKLNTVFVPIIRMAIALGFAAVLLVGSYWVLQQTGYITVSGLVVFAMMTQRLLWPLTRLGQTLDNYARARASATRIFDLLKAPSKIQNPTAPAKVDKVRGAIEFHQVKFHYQSELPILQGLDFTIAPGETVGFAGQTGAGKSTLIKLLLRLYDVSSGDVSIDGVDVRDFDLTTLRRNIALVSQDVYLFHGTIFDNIAYGNETATQADVVAAAKSAHLDQFITTLPDGYHTKIGERGIKLSGGQRQRLSIARAILKDAPIMIFDEATSSVDTETEREIQQNLRTITKGKTALIIAHRLSTIRDADRILVLADGKVTEQGKHEELLNQQGCYADLWAVQSGAIQI